MTLLAFLLALQGEPDPARLFKAGVDRADARPGDVVRLQLRIEVGEGLHLYSTTTDPSKTIPSSVELQTPGVEAAGKLEEPAPKRIRLFENEYDTHEGTVDFTLPVRIGRVPAGPLEIKGVFKGQACNDKNCFDVNLPFSVQLTVGSSALTPRKKNVEITGASLEPASGKPGDVVTLKVGVAIKEHWHLYGTKSEITPATFEFPGAPVEIAGAVEEPPTGTWKQDGKDYPIHEGTVEFRIPLRLGRGATDGMTIRGALTGQACDDKNCVVVNAPFEVTLGAGPKPEHLDNLDLGLAEAKRSGKPVFLEFTGEN